MPGVDPARIPLHERGKRSVVSRDSARKIKPGAQRNTMFLVVADTRKTAASMPLNIHANAGILAQLGVAISRSGRIESAHRVAIQRAASLHRRPYIAQAPDNAAIANKQRSVVGAPLIKRPGKIHRPYMIEICKNDQVKRSTAAKRNRVSSEIGSVSEISVSKVMECTNKLSSWFTSVR